MILQLQLQFQIYTSILLPYTPPLQEPLHQSCHNISKSPHHHHYSIMTIWERKKEKKKQAFNVSAVLGVVGLHTQKDIERNTEHVLFGGEFLTMISNPLHTSSFSINQSLTNHKPPSQGTCQLSCNQCSF